MLHECAPTLYKASVVVDLARCWATWKDEVGILLAISKPIDEFESVADWRHFIDTAAAGVARFMS